MRLQPGYRGGVLEEGSVLQCLDIFVIAVVVIVQWFQSGFVITGKMLELVVNLEVNLGLNIVVNIGVNLRMNLGVMMMDANGVCAEVPVQ